MKDLVRGIKVNLIGNVFRFSRSAFFVLAAILYGTELFGVYTIAWASAEIILRFSLLGLDNGLLFEISHFHGLGEKEKLYQKIVSSLKACLGISCLSSLGLILYAYFYVDVPLTRNSLLILAPILPFYNVGVLLIQATMGMKEMKYNAIIRSGIEPLTMLLLLFVFWKTPLKNYGIIFAQGLALIVVFILSLFSFRRFFSWREVFRTWKRPGRYLALIRYSIPMYIIEVVDTVLYRADIFLISFFLGTGTTAQMKLIGVYGFAKQIARVITQTKNAFAPIFVPISSETYLKEDGLALWAQVRFAMEKLLLLNIALGLFLVFFHKELIHLVGKDAVILSQAAYFWLLAGQFAYSTFSVLMFFLVTTQNSRLFLAAEITVLALAILSGTQLVPHFGATGAAATIGIAYLMISACAIIETLRSFRKNFFTAKTFRIALSGLFAGLLIMGLKSTLPTAWHESIIMAGAFLPGLGLYFAIALLRRKIS